jgi:polyether ionophore transport system permease protein
VTAPAAASPDLRAQRYPAGVVAGLVARRAIRSGAMWGYVTGAVVAGSALSYTSIYTTQAARNALAAAYGSNRATTALFGPAPQLQTVAGFTVFKVSMSTVIILALWAILLSTKVLRGEEDVGRWEMLLCGQTTRRGATSQAAAALGAGVLVLWMVTSLITIVAGRASSLHFTVSGSLFFAATLVTGAAMFAAVGMLTSQLAPTRRLAIAYAPTWLGASYALRVVADAGVGLHGLLWLSPLGWAEELRPFTSPRPWVFAPIVLFSAVVVAIALRLASTRDVGSAVAPASDRRSPRVRLLSGPMAFSWRLARGTITSWWLAIAILSLLYGLIAKSAGATMSGSSMQEVLSKFGAPGSGARAMLGVCFLELAVLLGFLAAGQVSAARAEESDGRLDNLVVRRVSRASWLGGRLGVGLGALATAAVVSGVATWIGAASQHTGVGVSTMLGASVNTLAPALVIFGVGCLALGAWPRAASVATYGVLCWSFLVELVGGIGAVNHWVLDTSVFHQMAAAPAVAPDWTANAVMIGIGVLCALLGLAAFARRDLRGA